MKSIKELFDGKKVLIFGLGIQGGGVGAARFAYSKGAEVKITDIKTDKQLSEIISLLPSGITSTLGKHDIEDIIWADIIIKNPAVPDNNEYIAKAHELGKKVYMSEALYLKYTTLKTIGITGTRGKSTTTNLTYQILNDKYKDKVLLGGNIPNVSTLELLDQEEGKLFSVLELSSFQLEGCDVLRVSPNIACITNIYEDHLNRYSSMSDYMQAKAAIIKYQNSNDYAILNNFSPHFSFFENLIKGNLVTFSSSSFKTSLIGKHNKENIAASSAIASVMGVEEDAIRSVVAGYRGLPYRLENIGSYRGITFINDTTSTTPIATIKAIESIDREITLILGGAEKGLKVDDLIDKLKTSSNIKNIIILGSIDNKSLNSNLHKIESKIKAKVNNMKDAVDESLKVTDSGQVILLSPAFASFDLFSNEFDRGEQFNKIFKNLSK